MDAPQGTIEIRPGSVAADYATFAAIKATAGGKTVAVYFGDSPYTDKSGLIWQPYQPPSALNDALLARVRSGLPLLIDTGDDHEADEDAQKLAAAGAFHLLTAWWAAAAPRGWGAGTSSAPTPSTTACP